jgi:O-antigen/teichoic acid export membrane protein
VNVFLSGLEMLSDLGIGMDVVQHKRGDDPVFLHTAFWIQAMRGMILWVIAALLAFPFAMFYREPEVRALIIVGAFALPIRGVTSSSVWLMIRHVRLQRLTLLNVVGDSTGLLVAVGWALFSPTAWALVAGKVATALAFVIASHAVSQQPVEIKWDRHAAAEIMAFGTGMFLSSATYFLSGEAERLVVGKFISIADLGCFSLALTISIVPLQAARQVISQVFFPMVSETARTDPARTALHLKRARLLLLAVSLSMGIGFILFSPTLVASLLGDKFLNASWMLQLLGFRAALELFGTAAGMSLFALGISRYAAIGNTSKLLFLAVGLLVAFSHFGFREALWVLAVSPVAHYIPNLLGLKRHLRPALASEVYCFAVFVLVTTVTSAALMFLS